VCEISSNKSGFFPASILVCLQTAPDRAQKPVRYCVAATHSALVSISVTIPTFDKGSFITPFDICCKNLHTIIPTSPAPPGNPSDGA